MSADHLLRLRSKSSSLIPDRNAGNPSGVISQDSVTASAITSSLWNIEMKLKLFYPSPTLSKLSWVMSSVWSGDGSSWERVTSDDPDKQSHGGLSLKWSTKSIKFSNSHINKCFVGQGCNTGAGQCGVIVVRLHRAQQIGSIDQTMQAMTLVAVSCLFCKYSSWQLINPRHFIVTRAQPGLTQP